MPTLFDFSHLDADGNAVYKAQHNIFDCVTITLPFGYFESRQWPEAIAVADFSVTPARKED